MRPHTRSSSTLFRRRSMLIRASQFCWSVTCDERSMTPLWHKIDISVLIVRDISGCKNLTLCRILLYLAHVCGPPIYRAQLKGLGQVWWIWFLLMLTTSARLCLQHSRNLGMYFSRPLYMRGCRGHAQKSRQKLVAHPMEHPMRTNWSTTN